MSTKRNILFDQNRFNAVKKWCLENGIVPQISKLKITKQLLDGVGLYEFDLKSRQLLMPGDVALFDNDVFIPMAMGVLLSFDSTTPTGKAPLFSYAPKAGAQNPYGFMKSDIEGLYNGVLKQTADQTVIMQSFPMEVFKHIGASVPGLIQGTAATVANGVQGEYDIEDMLHPVVPNIIYQGLMDIKTTIEFAATGSDFSVAAAATPSSEDSNMAAYISLLMTGVLVKNGAQSAKINVLTDALQRA